MNTKNILISLIVLIFTINNTYAQSFPKDKIKKKLKASKIEMDAGNGDGVFKAKSKKAKKWGMYQWMFEGTKVKELIPMEFDKVDYFPFNGSFTAVYIDGKLGIYLCEWSYGDDAKQTVDCKYDEMKRYNVKKDKYSGGTTYLAMKRDRKWGWVNWLTGEEMTEFIYDIAGDVPYPKFDQ